MNERDQILAELAASPRAEPPATFNRSVSLSDELWTTFEQRLVELGGQMLPESALPLLLSRDPGFWADEDANGLIYPLRSRNTSVWDAEVGVCVADFAIAETGSLVVSSGPQRSRLASLAPLVNIVLVRDSNIVDSVEAAFARMPETTTVLVTGTSRTADIEGVLVRGVHGPRELYVVRIERPW